MHRLPLSNAPVPVAVGRYCEHQVSGVICMYCVSSHDVATIAISVHDLQPFFDSVKQCLEAHAHQTHSLNRLLPSAGDTAGGSSAGALCAVLPANTTDLNAVVARMLPGSDLSCERQVRYGDKPCLFRTARAGVHSIAHRWPAHGAVVDSRIVMSALDVSDSQLWRSKTMIQWRRGGGRQHLPFIHKLQRPTRVQRAWHAHRARSCLLVYSRARLIDNNIFVRIMQRLRP